MDELPFDFERRGLSVVLLDLAGGSTKRTLVCKVCNKAFLQHILSLTIFYLLETLSKPISLKHLPNVATNTLSTTVCIGTHSVSFLYPYL